MNKSVVKEIFLFLFLNINWFVYTQNLEIGGGYTINTFYEFIDENPHYTSDYSAGNGYTVKLSIERFRLSDSVIPIRFEINYTNYKGHSEIMTRALGGGTTIYADIDRSVLGIALYPLLFCIKKRFRIDLGLELGILLLDHSKGYYKSWSMNNPQMTGEISGFNDYTTTFGFINQFGYEIRLKNNWFLFPRYHFYVGITNDYEDVKSIRNQFEVGLIKRIE